MPHVEPILAETLASKIEKLENLELSDLFDFTVQHGPRWIRALWFIQYMSWPRNYSGGLSKFANDLISSSIADIGPASLHAVGDRFEGDQYTRVMAEVPYHVRRELCGTHADFFEVVNGDLVERAPRRKKEEVTPAKVRGFCMELARRGLAEYLKQVCENPKVSFQQPGRVDDDQPTIAAPWYFPRILDAILAFVDRRRESLRSRIAETEITQLVSRWIKKSRTTKRCVMISGNSRFGKTEAVKLHAEIHPESCRLVNTPASASNSLSDLIREVAISLGMDVSGKGARNLRERVDYVLRFAHLQLCFDESQLLLPASFSRNVAPARLNWVRRSVMDQGIAAVFVCTPQSYLPAKKRFVKVTGFAMEQFEERILKTVHLPDELSEDDLLAVARIHFEGLRDEYLRYVVETALATERNYVSDIEKIATLAKDNAREHDRTLPTLADVKAAISDVLPTRATIVPNHSEKPEKPPFKRDAMRLQPCRQTTLTVPPNRRQMQPAPI